MSRIWVVSPGGRRSTGGICRVVGNALDAMAARGDAPPALLDSGGMERPAAMAAMFVCALASFARACLRRDVRLAHIHVATGGSLVRKAAFVAIARASGVPVALHLHGAGFGAWLESRGRAGRRLAGALLRAADAVVVLGEAGRRDAVARAGCDPRRVHVVPNAVPASPLAARHRADAGEAAPPCRILFLGALTERKGLDVLLEALSRPCLAAPASAPETANDAPPPPLARRDASRGSAGGGALPDPAVRGPSPVPAAAGTTATVAGGGPTTGLADGGAPTLVIAGDGAQAPWRARAAALGVAERVRFLGWTRTASALAEADLVVLPSRTEAMPMALLEAMAAGLPVVATRVGEVEAMVRHGRDGLLVAPGDPDALAQALARLAGAPALRHALGASGRARHAALFDPEAQLRGLDRVFESIAPSAGRRATEFRMTARPRPPASPDARSAGATPRHAPLRVSFYMHSLAAGGVERMRVNLLRQLDAWGAATTLLLHHHEDRLGAALPPRTRVAVFGTRRTALDLWPLVRHLRRDRPDLLVSSLGHNNMVALAAKAIARSDVRLVVCQHNALSAEIAADRRYRLLAQGYRRLGRFADAIVAVSEGVADDLAATAGIARDRITVIPNPVVTPELAAAIRAPNDDPWFAPGAPPVYVAVGRLVPQKDHATLLRAFARRRAAGPCRLVLIGEGGLRATLEAEVRALGIEADTRFLGHRDNPMPFIRDAAALVLSSRWEGLGNVLVEALACGTPVVATDCPHGPAEILEGGRYGRLVPPGDAAALAAALDPGLRAAFPAAMLRQRAAWFGVEASAQRLLDLARPAAPPARIAPAPVMPAAPAPARQVPARAREFAA